MVYYLEHMEEENNEGVMGTVTIFRYEKTCDINIRVHNLCREDEPLIPVFFLWRQKRQPVGEMRVESGCGSMNLRGLEMNCLIKDGPSISELEEIRLQKDGKDWMRVGLRESGERPSIMDWDSEEMSDPEMLELVGEKIIEGTSLELTLEREALSEVQMQEAETKKQETETQMQETETQENIHEREIEKPEIEYDEKPDRLPRMLPSKWNQICSIYPRITPFSDNRTYIKIQLQDFLLLPDCYYSLTQNSFLLHGYMNYGYLILGCIQKKQRTEFYLGVPGNYYEQEKQAARMYGFTYFDGSREISRDGDFGFYMERVEL